jgi:hypothetical protein
MRSIYDHLAVHWCEELLQLGFTIIESYLIDKPSSEDSPSH